MVVPSFYTIALLSTSWWDVWIQKSSGRVLLFRRQFGGYPVMCFLLRRPFSAVTDAVIVTFLCRNFSCWEVHVCCCWMPLLLNPVSLEFSTVHSFPAMCWVFRSPSWSQCLWGQSSEKPEPALTLDYLSGKQEVVMADTSFWHLGVPALGGSA